MTRLGKNGKAKPDRFRKAWNPGSIRIRSAHSGRRSSSARKKLSRGASLRGQGTPADPARLRSERARNLSKTLTLQAARISGVFGLRISRRLRTFESPCARKLRLPFPKIFTLFFLVPAEEFVPLDRGNHADRSFFPLFGALHAPKAAYPDRSRQCDFIRKSQQNLHRRTFLHVLGKEKVDAAGTHVPRFGAGFTNRRSRGPTHSERQPHGKTLGGAAFGAGQDRPPRRSTSVSGTGLGNNRTPGTKSIQF